MATGHLYRPKFRTKAGEVRLVSFWYWKAPTGRRYSTGHTTREAAERWVAERVIEIRDGLPVAVRVIPPRYEDLERLLIDDWTLRERRGLLQARSRLKHLSRAFSGWHAAAITTDKITAYALKRRKEGAAVATINFELALLRRALSVAVEAGRLDRRPVIHRLPGAVVRQGFLEDGDFERIVERLPESWNYRSIARFLKLSGWRLGEAVALEWRRVDLAAQEIRLDNSKNGQPRMLAFKDYAPLRELFEALAVGRRGLSPFVFPGRRSGRHLDKSTFEQTWRQAAIAAGVPKALAHDLRRSFVRACERAGVPRSVAMSITGHKSEDIYRRYAIASAADQQAALLRIGALAPTPAKVAQFPARG